MNSHDGPMSDIAVRPSYQAYQASWPTRPGQLKRMALPSISIWFSLR
jgi:hypothetical protein